MATRHTLSAQTGERGVALVRKLTTDAGAIFVHLTWLLGIYKLEDIKKHVNPHGHAMAIKLSIFEPSKLVFSLARIQHHLASKTTLQGLTPISSGGFEAIRSEGLS